MGDEDIEWKIPLLKIAGALALLDVLDLAICLGGAYAVWHRVAHR